ncbi:hypothetical protein OJ997_33260 [Solirubrobacter phytolaccae]|uniref:Uncharacterized protein n=1 Tax=Solirubrobacter phytolaccae TaxID=1404360 RepID=A0A9X3NFN9_9ACTN|nr:hypothetical protein [Solirubrobacter phytolaccae]MDA0185221.1 hypothetical protein [Solirubrobacter phytolaccae]
MTDETPQPPSSSDVPLFPHHAALPSLPMEAAERQYAERPAAAPGWQPEEGDFT